MKSKLFIALAILGFAAVVTSCGKLPQEQVDAAQAAIDSAKTVQADLYVPAEFTAVQDSMNVALANIEAQKSKLFKKYDAEKALLERIVVMANTAVTNSQTRKAEVIAEVQTGITDIKALVEENNTLIKKAPKGKEGAAALEAMKADLAAIETAVAESETLFTNGDYLTALDKVKAAKEKATAINTELKEVIAKVSKYRK